MKKYDITTKVVREIYTDYFIEANSEEEAIEIYKSGKSLGSETTEDMSEEEIIDINAYDIKKEKRYCPKCKKLLTSDKKYVSPDYSYACLDCEEDFYKFETLETN